MLALPLTAAVLLHATPTQMGLLTAMEVVPFVLFSLPSGVWLDRVRKLPVYVIGESLLALVSRKRSARVVARLAVDDLALYRRLRHWHRGDDRRQRGADRADASRCARALGRSAREKCARVFVGRSRRSGRGGRIDQAGRCADRAAGRCGVACRLRCDLARHSGAGGRPAGGGAVLAGDARRARIRRAAPVAGDDGVHRRRLADVPSRCARRADLVRDSHARLVRRRRRIVVSLDSASAPLSPAPSAIASRAAWAQARHWCLASRFAASVGCSARSHPPRRSELRCSRRC